MKIAICARTLAERGGIAVYTRNILESMLRLDSSHEYVVFYQNKAHLGQYSRYENVKEVFIPAYGKLLWDQVAVPYHAFKEKVDIIFHTKFAVPLLAHCKTVMVLHGSERFVYPEFAYKSDRLFTRTLFRLYLRHATAIISVCENARKDVIRLLKINPEKITTTHLSRASHFKTMGNYAFLASVREKYNLPSRFILNVGLIYPGKNIRNLLKALKLVRQKEDIKLVLVGTGKRMYKDDLDLIEELELTDHVLLPGYIPHEDLVGVYNLAEVLAFPSFYECFPAPPLEANACGCPVVTSRTGGTREAAGDAALYVEPTDVEEIADAIVRVLIDSELRRKLIENGFHNVKRFSWEKTARQTLDVFESLGKP